MSHFAHLPITCRTFGYSGLRPHPSSAARIPVHTRQSRETIDTEDNKHNVLRRDCVYSRFRRTCNTKIRDHKMCMRVTIVCTKLSKKTRREIFAKIRLCVYNAQKPVLCRVISADIRLFVKEVKKTIRREQALNLQRTFSTLA